MNLTDRTASFGLTLIAFGAPFAAFSHIVLGDATYTSLGLAAMIIGATALLVPSHAVPKESARALVEAAAINVEALLEEFDINSTGYYLPPKDGLVYCLVPLQEGFGETALRGLERKPLRLVVEVEGTPALVVFPPGGEAVRLSGLSEESGLEGALIYVLVDYLEMVESVRAVQSGDIIVVELVKPRVDTVYSRFKQCLGSVPCSVAGCILSTVLGKPLAFLGETGDERLTARFRVVETGQE